MPVNTHYIMLHFIYYKLYDYLYINQLSILYYIFVIILCSNDLKQFSLMIL